VNLSQAKLSAQIAVSTMARAREFYEGKLGLVPADGAIAGTAAYPCGAATMLYVYESPAHAGKSSATLAQWEVDDVERVVDELTAKGVTFEQYGAPTPTNAKGLHDTGYGTIAWLADPDGNIFEIAPIRPPAIP
jgi:catechol 2,3-dioxygenase-like lactoylglutathione lyase family enzyme